MAKLPTPLIVVNFKAFRESSGKEGLRLARLCERVAREEKVGIAVAPQTPDLALVAREVSIPVIAQHADNLPAGSFTGWLPPESLKASGVVGVLINHAEHQVELSTIESLVRRCRSFSLVSIVCADNLPIARAVAAVEPDFVAIEPPELIGGDVSVTTADPGIVHRSVVAVHRIGPRVRVLCGAGIKTGKDVAKALQLGTEGVLLSTGVVKAADPRGALTDLAAGLGAR